MNTSWTKIGLGVCALAALSGGAAAQKPSNAERGLVGVNLYDSGVKVVSLYGSPDEIQAVSLTSTSSDGSGGAGFGPSSAAGPSFGGGGGRPGASSPGPAPRADWGGSPFDFGNDVLRQSATQAPLKGGRGMAPPSSPSGSGQGAAPMSPAGSSSSGGSSAPGASETPVAAQYTRWVYNRAGSKYGFIVDNQGHVVQIEAIGLQNNRVKTRKGLGFGATFAQLIKSYGNPDGYEVAGDTILVKYLVSKKVAFRLTRLGAKKPHVVTGVVVSAGKV